MSAKWIILNIILFFLLGTIVSIHIEIMLTDTGWIWILLPIIASALIGAQVIFLIFKLLFNSK